MPRKKDLPYATEGDVFATRLREVMEEQEVNQTQLSAQLLEKYGHTMQRQTISLYMNGQSKPDTERLTLLCKVLNVSSDYLLGLSDVEKPDTDMRAICEKTGLSENAVYLLCNSYTSKGAISPQDMVSALLGDFSFGDDVWMNINDAFDCMHPASCDEDTEQAIKFARKNGYVLLAGFEAKEMFLNEATLGIRNILDNMLEQKSKKRYINGEHKKD